MSKEGNESPPSVRTILKRKNDPSGTAPTRIKWDEDNLALMESQKTSTMKITEPKTPFIHHSASSDQIFNTMIAMELEDAVNDRFSLSSENASKNGEIDMLGADKDWEDENVEEEEWNKRQKFNQLRAHHYNMKAVMQNARELVDNEDIDPDFNNPEAHIPGNSNDSLAKTGSDED